ncbi:ABC transporter permease [Paenibacillus arenosi]|uniref:ABC transporter permease n=1 Tax=Paenibacillus arenosi TaxID=2774142 RepID=A0ABR9B3Y4_9BACL|nr:ABC transporter permease [Paenibacillus arenosi]MBD8501060.1 ABC transporter permease [Paenibacillus arenosi]
MRQLLKYELIKLFWRKSVLIVFLLLMCVYGWILFYNQEQYVDASKIYHPYARSMTEADYKKVESISRKAMEKEESMSDRLPLHELGLLYDIAHVQHRKEHYAASLEQIREELSTYAQNTFEYKKIALAEQLLIDKGVPSDEVYYNKPWANIMYMHDQLGVLFMGAMILIGIAPLYSSEYSSRVDSLLLSSRHGRRKLVSAKCYAAIIYTLAFSSVFALLTLSVHAFLFGNLDGSQTPLYSLARYVDTFDFQHAPFSLTVGQYYLIQLTIHALGCIAFAMAVMFISSISYSSFITFMISGSIVAIPYLLLDVRNVRHPITEWLVTYSYSQFIRVSNMFSSFKAVNVGGEPVLYPFVALCVVTIVTLALIWGTRAIFSRRQSC